MPNLSDDANILITPGAGTIDAAGNVLEDRLRRAVRAVFGVLVLVQDLAERISAEPA